MQGSKDSADTKSARHGQFQEKDKKVRLLNWIFSFRKIFSTENNNF